ncbi:helix-turn-helix transcriptional regulator [Pseudoxanthomonas mexicana]
MATQKTIYQLEYRLLIESLRTRRESLGLSQSEVARSLGWRQQTLSAIEAGARRLDVIEFLKLCGALGLSRSKTMSLLPDF